MALVAAILGREWEGRSGAQTGIASSIQICNTNNVYSNSSWRALVQCATCSTTHDRSAQRSRTVTRGESTRSCCFYPEGGGQAGLWSQGDEWLLTKLRAGSPSCQGCTQGIFQQGDQEGQSGVWTYYLLSVDAKSCSLRSFTQALLGVPKIQGCAPVLQRAAPQAGVSPQCMASPALLLKLGDSVCPMQAWVRGKGCGICPVTFCQRLKVAAGGQEGTEAGRGVPQE